MVNETFQMLKFSILLLMIELHCSSIVKIKILFYSLSHLSHSLSHVSLSVSQSLILSLLSILTHFLSLDSKLHCHHTMAWPTITGHGKPPPTHYFSSLSRCRSVWWRGDQCWAVGCVEVGLIDISVGSECGDRRWALPWIKRSALEGRDRRWSRFCLGLPWVVWRWVWLILVLEVSVEIRVGRWKGNWH